MSDLSGTDSSMPTPPVEKQPTGRKLTREAVLDIWSRREIQRVYAARYRVGLKRVRSIQQGETSREVTADAPAPASRVRTGPKLRGHLSERERAIFDLRDQGMQWHRIADALGITVDAAKGTALRAKRANRVDGAA